MVLSKRFSKDITSVLPSVEEVNDAEIEEDSSETSHGIASRPPSRPLASRSRGSVDNKVVVRSARARSRNGDDAEIIEPEDTDSKEEPAKETSHEEESFVETKDHEEDWDTDLEIEDTKESYDATGKAKYLSVCELYGVIPISHYMQHMQDSEFIMDHRGLGIQSTKALAISLATNTSIVNLSLNDNALDGDCASALADMLKENCFITELHLANNKLSLNGAKVITRMLLENTTLRKLNLSGNQFNDQTASHFADVLINNQKLEYLDLSHNVFADGSGEILGNAIAENTGLLELNLSWNHFRGKAGIAIAKGLGANIFLKVLDLSYNGFSNDGASALGDALKVNNVLEELHLGNNRISLEGVVRFSLCMKENKTLRILRMNRNPILSEGCFAILKAIQANPESAMEFLDFSDIFVNQEFDALYDAVKTTMPNLSLKHGGNSEIFKKQSLKGDPVKKIKQFIKENKLQLSEFLEKMYKDKNVPMTHEVFNEDLMNIGIILPKDEQQLLADLLDKEKKGTIHFSLFPWVTNRDRLKKLFASCDLDITPTTFVSIRTSFLGLYHYIIVSIL
ncbi:leucine-rich repeat-containing protein 74B [Bombina bombina]|uniref:leucine-rich repeat-containing protein 74B n=1 Tax=Bombina bombina TaxID=8345 RepID=UPI00235ABB6B|nr:leucine-rich repeat-containing protein 74B [Bombina bombina]